MAADYVIGIDQGTSSTKALLLDREGRVVAQTSRPIETDHPHSGWVEQDPAKIVENVAACLPALLEQAGVAAKNVAGIGIDNHTETLVMWERDSGRPVHPAIVWQCRRSAAETETLDKADNRLLIRERTGLDLDPTFTATKLMWVFRHRPDIAEGLRSGAVLWGTLDTWLIWALTGGATYATESGNASRTMLFRIDRLAWDSDLLELFGLSLAALPEVRRSTGPFGLTDRELLGAQIPITGALGDQQASLFGHGCLGPGEFKCTYGTGAFLWMNVGQTYEPSVDPGILQTVAWDLGTPACGTPTCGTPTYAREGFVLSAGAILDWLADNLGLGRNADEIQRKAGQVANSNGVTLIPAIQGLGSPWWSPNVRAALMGMSSATEAAHVCRAALEAVTFQIRRVLEAMASAGADLGGDLRVDGGLTRSDLLMQMQADLLGRPLRRAEIEHLTPYGAGLLAGLGAGLWSNLGAVQKLPRPCTTFEPRDGLHDDLSGRYRDWCAAVERSLAWAQEQGGG